MLESHSGSCAFWTSTLPLSCLPHPALGVFSSLLLCQLCSNSWVELASGRGFRHLDSNHFDFNAHAFLSILCVLDLNNAASAFFGALCTMLGCRTDQDGFRFPGSVYLIVGILTSPNISFPICWLQKAASTSQTSIQNLKWDNTSKTPRIYQAVRFHEKCKSVTAWKFLATSRVSFPMLTPSSLEILGLGFSTQRLWLFVSCILQVFLQEHSNCSVNYEHLDQYILLLLYVYECFACMHICIPRVCPRQIFINMKP